MTSWFPFPSTVNENAARTVAAIVVVLTAIQLATGSTVVLAVIAYGFVARVLWGPRFSPVALLATRVIVPLAGLADRPTPGPPKRFAQGIGAVLSSSALGASLLGAPSVAMVLVAAITFAAFLEAAAGFCLGCAIFARLMRAGLVPETVCEACGDLSKRPEYQAGLAAARR